jgi:hypothetical protein
MEHKGIKLTAMALALALLTGCTQSQVLATLEASVAATEALVAGLQTGGKIAPGVATELEAAVAGLPAAYRETAAELASTDAAAAKAFKIAGYYASTVAALQALPPDARPYAAAIAASIQAFLNSVQQTAQPELLSAAPVRARVATGGSGFPERELQSICSRAGTLEERLTRLKKTTPAGEKSR